MHRLAVLRCAACCGALATIFLSSPAYPNGVSLLMEHSVDADFVRRAPSPDVGRSECSSGGACLETCDPPDNPCDLGFSTATLDCSTAYPAVGTSPISDAPSGFINFGAPQVSPLLVLKYGRSPYNKHVWALNPFNNEVTILDPESLALVASIPVGLRPSSIAQTRPGRYVLVSNWGSHSISMIDTKTANVVASIEHRDSDGRALLAEPMGIAVDRDDIAYIASSATNQVAVVDLKSRAVIDMIDVPTSDPRAIILHRRRRYLAVAGFAALNRTEPAYDVFDPELTGLTDPGSAIFESCGALVAAKPGLFDANDPAFMDPSDPDFRDAFNCYVGGKINSLFSGKPLGPIAVNPRIPDHDVAIIDTQSRQVVYSTNTLPVDVGTLNYGLAFDRKGKNLFLTTTHARNDLGFEFGNRPFFNRLVRFSFDRKTGALVLEGIHDVDVDAGAAEPTVASRAATPYAVTWIKRNQWALTAAASDRLIVVDDDGAVLDRIDVGFTPRGVVGGRRKTVYVWNAASFTVQRWDLRDRQLLAEGTFGDNPMPMEERHGFHLFNGGQFAVNGTFACATCHPDGDTDHIVWELNCKDGKRLTMTLRQIKDSLPYHWPGDKCNGKKILEDGVMGLFGQPGPPSACDVDLTWQFIESLRQPPPRLRPQTDRLSPDAELGLVNVQRAAYKTIGDVATPCNGLPSDPIAWPRLQAAAGDPDGDVMDFNASLLSLRGASNPFVAGLDGESCTNSGCHAAPQFGNGTFDGFTRAGFCAIEPFAIEAITFLGAHERMKSEDDGRGALYDFLVALERYRSFVGATGGAVLDLWGVPRPSAGLKGFLGTFFRHPELEYELPGTQGFANVDRVERFIQEAATGPSALTGRQATATEQDQPVALLSLMIVAADEGKVSLRAHGRAAGTTVVLVWDSQAGEFVGSGVPGGSISLTDLLAMLADDDAVTFTADLPKAAGSPFSLTRDAQPFLFSVTREAPFPVACSEGYAEQLADVSVSGDPGPVTLTFWGLNIEPGATVFVNGERAGDPLVAAGSAQWSWTLPTVPADEETLVLQVQNPGGLLSNEFAVLVVP